MSRGRIAKQGNLRLRRLIIDAASCYSRPIKDIRPEDMAAPEPVRAKAERCRHRLKKRSLAPKEHGVLANKAKVAVARELCEWIYRIAVVAA